MTQNLGAAQVELGVGTSGIDVGVAAGITKIKSLGQAGVKAGEEASAGIAKIERAVSRVDAATKRAEVAQNALSAAQGLSAEKFEKANNRNIAAQENLAKAHQALAKAQASAFHQVEVAANSAEHASVRATNAALTAARNALAEAQTFGQGTAARLERKFELTPGVDIKQTAPLIAQMREAEKAAEAYARAHGKIGLSAKETAFALRGVPAQFTDIAVSLQGGQNPLTVFLQQGGQLKDMFGGIGPAAKALGGYILGLVNPLTVSAAAVAGLAYAWHHYNNATVESAEITLKAIGEEFAARAALDGMTTASISNKIRLIKSEMAAQQAYASDRSHEITRFNWRDSAAQLTIFNAAIAKNQMLLDQLEAQRPIAESASALKANLDANKQAAKDAAKAAEDAVKAAQKASEVSAKEVAASQAKIAVMNIEMDGTIKLTDSQKKLIELGYEQTQSALKTTEAKYAENAARLKGLAVAELAAVAAKDARKAEEEQQKILEASGASFYKEIEAINKKIEASEWESLIIGKTKEEIELLKQARELGTVAMYEEELALKAKSGASEMELAQIRMKIAGLKDLAAQEGETAASIAASQAANEAIKAQTKAAEDQWKMIDGFAQDAFNNIFDKGKDVFKSLGDAIKKYVLDALYKMTLQKFLINVGIGGAGVGASGIAQAGGMGDIFSAGSSLWQGASAMFGGGMTAAGLAGITGGTGLAGLAAAGGGAMPIMSAAYSAPAIAGGAGISSMISTAMPYIGAAVLAYSLLKGNGGTPTSSTGDASMNFAASGAMTGRNVMGGDYIKVASESADAFVIKMNEGYLAAAKNLGMTAMGTTFTFASNTGEDGKNPNFGLSGGVIGGTQFSQGETATSEAAMVLAYSKAIFQSLKDSVAESTSYLSYAFNTISDIGAASQSQIDAAMQYAQTLTNIKKPLEDAGISLEQFVAKAGPMNMANETLAQTTERLAGSYLLTDGIAKMMGVDTEAAFGAVGLASLETRDKMVQLMGGLQQAGATAQSFYDFTTTDAEKLADRTKTVQKSFTDLGFVMPTTAAGLDELVTAQLALGNTEAAAKLMLLTDAVASVVPSAEAAAQALENMFADMANSLASLGNTGFGADLANANANTTMGAVTAAMPWITSIGQLATISASDFAKYDAANQAIISRAITAAAQTQQYTSQPAQQSAPSYDYAPSQSTPDTSAADSAAQNALNLAKIMSGIDYNAATAGMSQYEKSLYDIGLANADLITQATALGATTEQLASIYADGTAQAAALTAARDAELAKTNLSIQQQIDVLNKVQTQRQVDLSNALKGVDVSTALLITQLFGLQDAATAAADAAALAAEAEAKATALAKTNLGIQQQIDVLTGTSTQRQVDLTNALEGVDASTAALITTLFGLQDAATAAAEAQAAAQENLSTAKSDLLEAYNRESSAAQQLADRMTGFADGFNKLRASLSLGAMSTLSPEAKYQEARRQFEDVSRRANLGDEGALEELSGVSQSFLEASRDYNASNEQYARDFASVDAALQSSAATAARQASIASQQVDLMLEQLTALGLINDSVLSMAAALGNYVNAAAATSRNWGENQDLNKWLAQATGYTGDFGSGGFTSYLSNHPEFDSAALLAAAPQFAAGGTHFGGLRIVGENGPELEATGPSRIYNFEQTRQMLNGGDNAETNKLLKEVVTELRALVNQGGAVGSATLTKLNVVADKLDGQKREMARAA